MEHDLVTAERYHDISCGHRVVGHEGKCANFHGHNYRIHFTCQAYRAHKLDAVGRVIDFSAIKHRLCMWLEDEWDHKMLLWETDHALERMKLLNPGGIVVVPFNPTAENMAIYLLKNIRPDRLHGTGVDLVRVRVEETRKCSATAERAR